MRDDGVVEEGLALGDGDGREETEGIEGGGGSGAETGDGWGDSLHPVDTAAAEVGHRDGFPGRRVVAVVEPEGELKDDLIGRFGGEVVGAEVGGPEGGDFRVDELIFLLEVVVERAREVLPVLVQAIWGDEAKA